MTPLKIVGGLLILLGFAFRAVSLLWFRLKEQSLPDDPKARRRFEARRRRALFWDACVVALGFYVLLMR